jgi:hypothetical protein
MPVSLVALRLRAVSVSPILVTTNAAMHLPDLSVFAGLDPAIQALLDAWLEAGHDIVNEGRT